MRSSLTVIALCLLAGCDKPEAPTAQAPTGTPVVYTTFYPTEYFAGRIAGDVLDVTCPLPDDADPIYWEPSRDEIAAFQSAHLIIINGAEFEKWVASVSLPESRVVDTAAGFEEDWVTYVTTTHSHGAGGEHTHEGIDGHTWLDPINAIAQAEAIQEAMIEHFPEHETVFRVSIGALRMELTDLDARFKALTPKLEGVQLIASHPAYNYVAARYGWDIANLDLDPESPPAPRDLFEIDRAIDPDISRRIMLWESAPNQAMVDALDERGIVSVTFSPCEMLDAEARAAGADYISVMRDNLDRLGRALGESGG